MRLYLYKLNQLERGPGLMTKNCAVLVVTCNHDCVLLQSHQP